MKIGIDIDNVISDLDKTFLEEFLKEDKNKRNTGIINKNVPYIRNGKFDWTDEEEKLFIWDISVICNQVKQKYRIL